MKPDLEKYRHHVDAFDLGEEQKVELLQTIWKIMQSFVDRAFGDDPVQHCLDGRPGTITEDASQRSSVIDLTASEKIEGLTDVSEAFQRHAEAKGGGSNR